MSQGFYEAAPYFWEFMPVAHSRVSTFGENSYGSGPYGGARTIRRARRHQEGGYVEQDQPTTTRLLTAVAAYEDQLAARSRPVSPEWGQTFGSTAAQRARLISNG